MKSRLEIYYSLLVLGLLMAPTVLVPKVQGALVGADTRIAADDQDRIATEIARLKEPLQAVQDRVTARLETQSETSLRALPGWTDVEQLRQGLARIAERQAAGDLTAAYEAALAMTRRRLDTRVEAFLRQPLVNRWGNGDGLFDEAAHWEDASWAPAAAHHAAWFDFAPPAATRYAVTFRGSMTNDRAWIGTRGPPDGEVTLDLAGHDYVLKAVGRPGDNTESLRVRGAGETAVRVRGGRLVTRTFSIDGAQVALSGAGTRWEAAKVSERWSRSCRPVIGDAGTGRLTVAGGAIAMLGTAEKPVYLTLGNSPGGHGVLDVRGADSLLEVHYLDAGLHARGSGEMTVREGGTLNVHWAFAVGSDDGGTGILTVDGGYVLNRGRVGVRLLTNSVLRVVLYPDPDAPAPLQCSQTEIQGGVFELDLAPGFHANAGDVFTLIDSGTIRGHGQFRDLPEGAVIERDGYRFRASYQGGSRTNSFTLTALAAGHDTEP